MTSGDRKRHLEKLVEVRALRERAQHELALLLADKDGRKGAMSVSKQDELDDLLTQEQRIEDELRNAQEVEGRSDVVSIGSTVLLKFKGGEEPQKLVIEKNGNAAIGIITPGSPIAKALLEAREVKGGVKEGARVGDTVVAGTPSGLLEMKVLKITVEET